MAKAACNAAPKEKSFCPSSLVRASDADHSLSQDAADLAGGV
jgi:hypothetical protein